MELPLELEEWLDDLPLSRNIAKNFVRVFSDGVLVAEIVARQFPKLVQLHNYSEQNTLDGKRANWALLNKKVLSKLRCPLSAEQIDTLCQWSSSETLIEFLSVLKLKMAAYEPIYLAQQASITAKAQEEKDALRIKKHESKRAPAAENELALAKESTQQSPPADMKPNSAVRPSATGGRSKPANTPKRRHPDGSSNHNSNAAAAPPSVELPSAESIDEMYMKLTDSLVADLTQLTSRLDALEAQSAEFDAEVRRHRQQNLEELRRTEARVARLQLEQREIEQCGASGVMVAIDNAFGDDIDSLSDQAWATLGPEDIDNFAVQQLVEEIDNAEAKAEEADGRDDGEADSMYSSDSDDSLTPPPPPPPPPARLCQQAALAPVDMEQRERGQQDNNDHDDAGKEDEYERAQAAKPGEPGQQTETAQASADWLQCWDAASQKNYFANPRTGATQWEIPTAGIIKCRDASTQRVYFVDAATQETAWRIDELSSVKSRKQSAS